MGPIETWFIIVFGLVPWAWGLGDIVMRLSERWRYRSECEVAGERLRDLGWVDPERLRR